MYRVRYIAVKHQVTGSMVILTVVPARTVGHLLRCGADSSRAKARSVAVEGSALHGAQEVRIPFDSPSLRSGSLRAGSPLAPTALGRDDIRDDASRRHYAASSRSSAFLDFLYGNAVVVGHRTSASRTPELPCEGPSIDASLHGTSIDEVAMSVVTVSPKFQVVIPRAIREAMGLEPGQKVQALQYQNRIEFIPVRSMRAMRGFLKGIDTSVPRDADRV